MSGPASLVDDLLNPALVALLAREAAAGYDDEHGAAMAWPLVFVAVPMVLHGPTQKALPKSVATYLPNWAAANPLLAAGVAPRSRSLTGHVRAGVRFGLRHGLLELDGSGGLLPGPVRPGAPEGSLLALHRSALLVGRWFGRSAEPASVLSVLRVRP